ncbi:hypothetical protein C8T65DRAFT_751225, partial [Cerioporus squamosus]
IPDPPRRHFSQDISALFLEWDHGTLLRIDGHAIPLKYWPEIYQKRHGKREGKSQKDDAWEGMKVEYCNWKRLVEEKQRLGSEAAFWATYSDDAGRMMQYSQILAQLKRTRLNSHRENAQAAREYFGGDLTRPDTEGVFMYKKGVNTLVYTKDKNIAEQWLKLLARNQVIAANWETMQAAKALTVRPPRPPASTGHM